MNTQIATSSNTSASGAVLTDGRLAESLAILAKSVNASTSDPILANVLIEHDGRMLRVSATDLETRAVAEFPCDETFGSFSTTVWAKSLLSLLKGKKGAVKLQLLEQKLYVTIGGATTALPTLPSAEYPPSKVGKVEVSTLTDYASFRKVFTDVSQFASREEARGAVLMSTFLNLDRLCIAATDGYTLASHQLNVSPVADRQPARERESDSLHFLVPPTVRKLLAALKPEKATNRTLHITIEEKAQIRFAVAMTGVNYNFTARLVDGNYPNLDRVMPARPTNVVNVDRVALLSALKGAQNVVDRYGMCKFTLSDEYTSGSGEGTLKISATNDVAGDFETTLPVDPETMFGQIAIGFHVRRFIDALKPFDGEFVQIAVVDPLMPATLTNPDGTGITVVTMPMRLG